MDWLWQENENIQVSCLAAEDKKTPKKKGSKGHLEKSSRHLIQA